MARLAARAMVLDGPHPVCGRRLRRGGRIPERAAALPAGDAVALRGTLDNHRSAAGRTMGGTGVLWLRFQLNQRAAVRADDHVLRMPGRFSQEVAGEQVVFSAAFG